MTVRQTIAEALERAAREIGAEGELPDLELARTRNSAHGDFASSAGLKLARILRRRHAQIAEELVAAIRLPGGEADAEAAGGYVNFRLRPGGCSGWSPRWSRPDRATARATSAAASGSRSSTSAPTRPARSTSATGGGRSSATRWPPCSSSPATRPGGSTTSTTTEAGAPVRRLHPGPPPRPGPARERLRRRLHQRARREGPGRRRGGDGRGADGVRPGTYGGALPGPPRAPRRALRRVVLGEVALGDGRGAAGDRAAPREGPPEGEGRRHLVRSRNRRGGRRRRGPGRLPLRRRPHLLRLRPRLPLEPLRDARLPEGDRGVGRGPPRLRAADEAGLRRPRLRPRAAGDHHQPVRDPEGGKDVEAGRAASSPSRSCSTRSVPTRSAGSTCPARRKR